MLAWISHNACLLHDAGLGHPERPDRLRAIDDQLIASGMEFVLKHIDAPRATREQLERVHSARHVEHIFTSSPDDGIVPLDGDTFMMPHTLEAALRSAGAAVRAVDIVMEGSIIRAFCGTRPPGHHAERDRAMGFCYFNNIAVAAAHAMAEYKLERIAIVDFDVHHGNGTEHIFAGDDRILFCSSFQHPFYPNSGDVPMADNCLPLPLPAGTKGQDFKKAVEAGWLPQLDAFAPELILVSAGFDGHVEDEMSQFLLNDDDYGWITGELVRLSDKHAEGRIVSTLEGGYHLRSLARSVVAHLKAMQ